MSDSAPAASVHSSDHPDSTYTPQSLASALYDRREEYVRPHRIRLKIGTWNVAACPGTDKDLAGWFVDGRGLDEALSNLKVSPGSDDDVARDSSDDGVRLVGGDKIGLYVLGLQEIVDLGLAKEAYNRMYAGSSPMDKWVDALEAAMPKGYELVSAEHMSGLALLIYASPEVAPTVTSVSTSQIGTGLLGYMGNKGAISTRVVLGETTRLVFVNSHLASGPEQTYLDRRVWDVAQVLSRTQFDSVPQGGVKEDEPERIGDEDFAFWFGDLNFRVDGLPGDDIRRLLRLHTLGEYDVAGRSRRSSEELGESVIVMKSVDGEDDDVTDRSASPSPDRSSDTADTSLPDPDDFLPKDDDDDDDDDDFLPDPHNDPASLQATLDSILPHDQLHRLMKSKKALYEGWREAPIAFLPTYKYDVGTVGLFDSSEKKRAPSWCDRVLYRTRRDREADREGVREAEEARRRDEEMKARGVDAAAEDDDVLFAYDPDTDGRGGPPVVEYDYEEYEEEAEEEVTTSDGFKDRIRLDVYTSHQKVTSSDHKPVISLFTLDYDAVVPELKAGVHAEVARELDRAENEGRPSVTIVVERQNSKQRDHKGGDESVDFGELGFLGKRTCSLMIANTGGVPATFSFVDKPSVDDGSGPPAWLTTNFLSAEEMGQEQLGREVTLQPGETAGVLLQALVDDLSLVQSLNRAETTLEDVLVLRVEDGRDYFIPVHAAWLPTSFSRSVEELVRIPSGSIRSFVEKEGIKGKIPTDKPPQCAAPRELLRLTEALESLLERAVADENMLEGCEVPRADGWPFEASTPTRAEDKAALVAALDTDESLVKTLPVEQPAVRNVEVIAELLLLFLRSVTDGIVPAHVFPLLPAPTKEVEDTKAAVLDALASASPSHNVSFVFLAATLARVVEAVPRTEKRRFSRLRGEGGGARGRVAAVLAPVVFRVEGKGMDRAKALLEVFLRK